MAIVIRRRRPGGHDDRGGWGKGVWVGVGGVSRLMECAACRILAGRWEGVCPALTRDRFIGPDER